MIIRSGWYVSNTSFNEASKSPTRLQQIHPELISVTSIPALFIKVPSIPISPNSFSIKTICSPGYTSLINFFMNVVLPAPRKPDIISTFVI